MFGWIPIIGPIIDGLFSVFRSFQKGQRVKTVADAAVDIAAMKYSTDLTEAFKDDIGVRLARDLIMFPVAIWTSLISWDTIVAENLGHDWQFHIARYPDTLAFLPYAVLTFLFGSTAMTIYKRFK